MTANDRALKIERLYQKIESEILSEIAKLIKYGTPIDEVTNIIDWRIEKLGLLNELNNRQRLLLADYAGTTLDEVNNFLRETGYEAYEETYKDIKPYIQLGIRDFIEPDNVLSRTLHTMNQITLQKINMINANLLQNAGAVYVDIITKAATEVTIGNKAATQAIIDAIKEASAKGIPALITKNGSRLSLEGYIPTVIRSTSKDVAAGIQNNLMDEYDIDLVEISSHMGSRPSHAPFQGRIYSRSGLSEDYPPLEITGYGRIDGLITGINCRHKMYPYIEDVSVERYEPYGLKENEEAYKLQQEQRRLEREIRRAKKVYNTLKTAGASKDVVQDAKKDIVKNQAKIRQFIETNKLTRYREREQVRS